MGTKTSDKWVNYSHRLAQTKQQVGEHSWSTFDAWMSHEQTQIHRTHHSLDLGEATTFPLIIFFFLGHKVSTQMSFCLETPKLGVLKFSKLGLL
jgi:hypothetical protein